MRVFGGRSMEIKLTTSLKRLDEVFSRDKFSGCLLPSALPGISRPARGHRENDHAKVNSSQVPPCEKRLVKASQNLSNLLNDV